MMKSKPLLLIAAVSSLVIAGLLGYWFLILSDNKVELPVVENCSLQLEACSVSFPEGGSMTFEISPKQPSSKDALQLQASFDQIQPQVVGVRFKGIDMNMGYLEHFVHNLPQNNISENPASFGGQAGVFACANGLMPWLVMVQVQVGNTRYEVPFNFETM